MREISFTECHEKLLNQLAIEFICKPSAFNVKVNVITFPALNEGRRSYSSELPFLKMAFSGANTVIMAGCFEDALHWQ